MSSDNISTIGLWKLHYSTQRYRVEGGQNSHFHQYFLPYLISMPLLNEFRAKIHFQTLAPNYQPLLQLQQWRLWSVTNARASSKLKMVWRCTLGRSTGYKTIPDPEAQDFHNPESLICEKPLQPTRFERPSANTTPKPWLPPNLKLPPFVVWYSPDFFCIYLNSCARWRLAKTGRAGRLMEASTGEYNLSKTYRNR